MLTLLRGPSVKIGRLRFPDSVFALTCGAIHSGILFPIPSTTNGQFKSFTSFIFFRSVEKGDTDPGADQLLSVSFFYSFYFAFLVALTVFFLVACSVAHTGTASPAIGSTESSPRP